MAKIEKSEYEKALEIVRQYQIQEAIEDENETRSIEAFLVWFYDSGCDIDKLSIDDLISEYYFKDDEEFTIKLNKYRNH